jgi:alpha-L-fucosidase
VVDRIWEEPWQTDTCIGHWHYDKEAQYKSPKIVIDMLVDIVSRNGNLLLNFPLPSNGMLDPEELKILAEITDWMAINSEAIYGTRPWKIFGAGAATEAAPKAQDVSQHHQAGAFNERFRKPLTAADVRFTAKGETLYAFVMGEPEKAARIPALALGGPQNLGKIRNVELLGAKGPVEWRQNETELVVQLPPVNPSRHAIVFRVVGA